mgnify:CR=1 FL=1
MQNLQLTQFDCHSSDITLDYGINVGVRLLIFELFSSGYVLIKGGTFIKFSIFYLLNIFLLLFFLQLCKKNQIICYFKRGLHLFKGLCLLFLPNVPGATLIQGATFIVFAKCSRATLIQEGTSFPNSRVMMTNIEIKENFRCFDNKHKQLEFFLFDPLNSCQLHSQQEFYKHSSDLGGFGWPSQLHEVG